VRAAVYHGSGDVRVEDRERPTIAAPTDAVVRVTHTAVCGSDLWFYRGERDREVGSAVGHEPMGVVEEVGSKVRSVEVGDRVFAPFRVSCGACEFCRKGLHTSCENGASWGGANGGAQGEYVRSPHADGTLVRVPDRYADDEATLRALLSLTDVMGTGHHAVVSAGVTAGATCVVFGDGAVGLCAVLAARRLGAERIVAVGHHADRLELAAEFGATETVLARGEEAVERARELTDGGAAHVAECVGGVALSDAVAAARPGGTVGYVGVPTEPFDVGPAFSENVALRGGVAPVRAYADDLMADVLGGTLDPSPVFTHTVSLEDVPEGYRLMDEREAIKVLVEV
jgi:alcohol dehydrogenase